MFFAAQKPDGRIPCMPHKDQTYNMCEVFVDSVLRYWRWIGDDVLWDAPTSPPSIRPSTACRPTSRATAARFTGWRTTSPRTSPTTA